jgi:hypothetical protein
MYMHIWIHTSHRNVTRNALIIAQLAEVAECSGHMLLHPLALFLEVCEGGDAA